MSRSRIIAPAFVAAAALALLAGCQSTATGDDSTSAAPTPTAEATETPAASSTPVAATPTCDDLAGPDLLAKFASADFTLDSDWAPTTSESFEFLHPFYNDGGLVCIWGHDDYPEQPTTLAWSRLTPESRDALVAGFATDGSAASPVEDGTLYTRENSFDSVVYGYVVRAEESFYATTADYLAGMTERVDAITAR